MTVLSVWVEEIAYKHEELFRRRHWVSGTRSGEIDGAGDVSQGGERSC